MLRCKSNCTLIYFLQTACLVLSRLVLALEKLCAIFVPSNYKWSHVTASVDCFATNLIVSKYLCLVLKMEIYFNHKCIILLLPRGSHSIVGPARFAIKRIISTLGCQKVIQSLLWRKNEPSYRIWGWLSHTRAGREGKKLGFYHLAQVVIWIGARAFCERLAWMSRVKIRNSSSLARDSPMQCRLPGLKEDWTHIRIY